VQAELDKVSKELENVGEDREALKIALLAKETQLLAIKLSKETYLRGMAKETELLSKETSQQEAWQKRPSSYQKKPAKRDRAPIKRNQSKYLRARGMAKGIDCRSPFASFTHSYSHLLRQYSLRQ
jgi:hypothetical protein